MELDEQIAWLENELRWATGVITTLAFGTPEADDAARIQAQIDEVLSS